MRDPPVDIRAIRAGERRRLHVPIVDGELEPPSQESTC